MRVKRILFIAFALLFAGVPLLAYQSPGAPTGFVNDFAGIFSASERQSLEAKLSDLEKTTSAEVSVVTVSSLGGDTIENFAVKLFAEWGIGKEKSDNGLLLLIAPTEREVRIEVGYGLEPVVTDAASSIIIRNVITPAFKAGNYFSGVDGAVDKLSGLIQSDPATIEYVKENVSSSKSSSDSVPDYFYLIFIGFIVVMNLLGIMARSKSWWLGGVIGIVLGAIFAGLTGAAVCAVLGLGLDFVLSRWCGNLFKGRGPGGPFFFGGGRGSGGSSFGGGGFGGFGGGMSGGGGASGRW